MNRLLKKLIIVNSLVLLLSISLISGWFKLSFIDFIKLALLAAMLAVGLSVLIRKLFFDPIADINVAVRRISRGEFDHRLPVTRQDELGGLANDVQVMAQELKLKITQITEDRNELQAILSSMVEGVVVIDQDQAIRLINEPVLTMLDLRTKHSIGRPYWEVIRHEEINGALQQAMQEKQSLQRTIHLISPTDRDVFLQISPVLFEQGGVKAIVAVFHDITELKKIDQLRSDFVANVSHELKTPLTAIRGFVETLRDGAIEDPQTARKFIEIIHHHSLRLEKLVNDLLSLAALESKRELVEWEEVNLKDILDAVIEVIRPQIEQKKILWSEVWPDVPVLLKLDRLKIEQVFLNLLDNAVKYTPEMGSIVVKVTLLHGAVRCDVSDTGIGIDPQHHARIFERFYRVDKARVREFGGSGSGLGLAIVKEIVTQHGGKVSVTSQPGQGSTFSVVFPFSKSS